MLEPTFRLWVRPQAGSCCVGKLRLVSRGLYDGSGTMYYRCTRTLKERSNSAVRRRRWTKRIASQKTAMNMMHEGNKEMKEKKSRRNNDERK